MLINLAIYIKEINVISFQSEQNMKLFNLKNVLKHN